MNNTKFPDGFDLVAIFILVSFLVAAVAFA